MTNFRRTRFQRLRRIIYGGCADADNDNPFTFQSGKINISSAMGPHVIRRFFYEVRNIRKSQALPTRRQNNAPGLNKTGRRTVTRQQ